ncbi:MAG TPA: porin family protein [Chryseolinea sp.]
MTQKIGALVFFLGISCTLFAQTENAKPVSRRPDIPGTFAMELGFNFDTGAPEEFSLGFWGSRTFNLYYQYEFRILKSSFSFVPGIGLSLERFKFNNEYTLDHDPGDPRSMVMIPPGENVYPNIKKSQLITNYIDVPLELRYSTNPDDPARSFKVSFGGRIGYMYDSFTKMKYKEDSEVKKVKDKQDFNLSKLRYGLTARLGIGSFSLFGYYNLTPLFEEGEGISDISASGAEKNDFSTLTIGISLASF